MSINIIAILEMEIHQSPRDPSKQHLYNNYINTIQIPILGEIHPYKVEYSKYINLQLYMHELYLYYI